MSLKRWTLQNLNNLCTLKHEKVERADLVRETGRVLKSTLQTVGCNFISVGQIVKIMTLSASHGFAKEVHM